MMTLVEIKTHLRIFLVIGLIAFSSFSYSQNTSFNTESLKPDPAKEKMFLPYLATRHGGLQATETWKQNNTVQYYKELWYFCESFHIKRDHLNSGAYLNESMIDITRFESSRKQNEEAIVVLPGFKDALVLKPINTLIYKPNY